MTDPDARLGQTFLGCSLTLCPKMLVGAILASVFATALSGAAPGWSQFKGDNFHSGCAIMVGSKTGQPAWAFGTGGGIYSAAVLSPSGVLYFGSSDHSIYALNAVTGAMLWSYQTNGAIGFTSPLVDANDTVYVASWDSTVYALDANSGALKWSYVASDYVDSPLVMVDDIVYGGLANNDAVIALFATTGRLVWTSAAGAGGSGGIVSNGKGLLFAASRSNLNFSALNDHTGDVVWSVPVGAVLLSAPSMDAYGVAYDGGNDERVYALYTAAGGGAVKWTFQTNGAVRCTPTVCNGVVYATSQDGSVSAIESSSGTQKWRVSIGDGSNIMDSAPVLGAEGLVYVGSSDTNVYALNSVDGSVVWKYMTRGSIVAPPTVGINMVYVSSTDNTMYAFN